MTPTIKTIVAAIQWEFNEGENNRFPVDLSLIHIYKWAEYLPFFEKAINENYSKATSYTPIELDEDKKPVRFWTKYVSKPENQNVPIPLSVKAVSYTHLDVYKRQQ